MLCSKCYGIPFILANTWLNVLRLLESDGSCMDARLGVHVSSVGNLSSKAFFKRQPCHHIFRIGDGLMLDFCCCVDW